MNPLELHIKTTADLKAAKDAVKTYEDLIKDTKALGGDSKALEVELGKVKSALASEAAVAVQTSANLEKVIATTKRLGGDTKALQQQLASAKSKIGAEGMFAGLATKAKEIKGAYQDAGGGIAGMFAAVGASGPVAVAVATAAAAAIGLLKKSIEEYAGAETQVFKLNAALAQNNDLTKENSEHYQDLADALQKATGIDDDKWIAVMTRLTQFGARPGDMQKTVDAVVNLAGILGGDIETSAEAVSKALQGNYESFGRLGIVVSDVGTQTAKFNLLCQQLQQRGAGQLAAATEGLTGAMTKLKNATGDVLKDLGQRWNESSLASRSAVTLLTMSLDTLHGWISKAIPGGIDKMRNAGAKLPPTLEEAQRASKAFAHTLETVENRTNRVTQALTKQLDALKETQKQQDEMTDAQMALALAEVDAQEKGGQISPSDAVAARVGIRRQADIEKFQRSQQTTQEAISTLKAEERASMKHLADAGLIAGRAEAAAQADPNAVTVAKAQTARDYASKVAAVEFPQLEKLRANINSTEDTRAHEARIQTIKGQTSILTGETEIAQSRPGTTGPRFISPGQLRTEAMRQFGISGADQSAAVMGNVMNEIANGVQGFYGTFLDHAQDISKRLKNLESRVNNLNNS